MPECNDKYFKLKEMQFKTQVLIFAICKNFD